MAQMKAPLPRPPWGPPSGWWRSEWIATPGRPPPLARLSTVGRVGLVASSHPGATATPRATSKLPRSPARPGAASRRGASNVRPPGVWARERCGHERREVGWRKAGDGRVRWVMSGRGICLERAGQLGLGARCPPTHGPLGVADTEGWPRPIGKSVRPGTGCCRRSQPPACRRHHSIPGHSIRSEASAWRPR